MTRSTEAIEADIAATREGLADTIDALGDKLDVAAHLKESAHDPLGTARNHWRVLAVAGSAVVVVTVLVVRRRRG